MPRLCDVQVEDRERVQIGVPLDGSLSDGVVMGRFLAPGVNDGENLIDPVPVALQDYRHRSIGIVSGGAGEILHDRLLLDHGPEADLLDLLAADSRNDGPAPSAVGVCGDESTSARENPGE